MELDRAIEIVKALSDGHDPYSGEVFGDNHVFQKADAVRALYLALEALNLRKRNNEKQRRLPENAGKPWSEEESKRLSIGFDQGKNILFLAQEHGRTQWAIRSKLIQLGKIQY